MRTRILPRAAALAALVAAPALAENCSTLAASVSVTEEATSASIDVTGTLPGAPTFLIAGPTAGEFALDLGALGGVTLGVAPPFAVLPLGVADGDGNVSLAFEGPGVPAEVPTSTLHLQALSFGFDIGPGGLALEFCESNVVAVEL